MQTKAQLKMNNQDIHLVEHCVYNKKNLHSYYCIFYNKYVYEGIFFLNKKNDTTGREMNVVFFLYFLYYSCVVLFRNYQLLFFKLKNTG